MDKGPSDRPQLRRPSPKKARNPRAAGDRKPEPSTRFPVWPAARSRSSCRNSSHREVKEGSDSADPRSLVFEGLPERRIEKTNGADAIGKSSSVPQNVKHRTTIWSGVLSVSFLYFVF